ncbi:carbohydrate ABC transporter membrane protein 1 (CUT1 family) [Microbacteriaceae bacterium MWH-Ta3]|nr:carbohydrate ABC transporter membrane protein 1 (CUT1 family) [Microbacteriaceae bacterium MWH-Ta3]
MAKKHNTDRLVEAASGPTWVIILKIMLLAVVTAVSVYAIFMLVLANDYVLASIVAVATLAINYIYLRKGALPAKYLTPGIIFLLIFQVFVVGYSAFIGFTNYSTGHNGTKEMAIDSLLEGQLERIPDSPEFALSVVEKDGVINFLVTQDCPAPVEGVESEPCEPQVFIGNATTPLQPVTNANWLGDKASSLPGYETIKFDQILERQDEILAITVPFTDDPTEGALQTTDGRSAYLYMAKLVYDPVADTMTNTETGVVYTPSATGSFVSESGEELQPGWRTIVGLDNFIKAINEDSIREPFIGVLIWTFVFAFLSMAFTFILGLFLAIMFNDPRMKLRKFYRIIVILPYAFPAFLSALVWAGMFRNDTGDYNGFINQMFFGGASIPWLSDPLLAKVSLLLVNLWLGFPYMFLVTTGALQAIPEELNEAARVDGATPWQIFRRIKFPLLMVSVAPLLISTFAFNFNNFNLIYMLTGGGPADPRAGMNVGSTDILISMVYKIAFDSSVRDYGLASAFTILIFLIVVGISVVSFRRTKMLEDLN